MKEQPTPELVEQLFAEIERAWMDRRDRTTVYKLADLHPELRDELYEFYEDLVLGPNAELAGDFGAAEARVADWLRTTGFGLARSAAMSVQSSVTTAAAPGSASEEHGQPSGIGASPRATSSVGPTKDETWLTFLKRRTGENLPGLVQSLTDATSEFVVLVSRHPQVVPPRAKRELARQIEAHWGINADESLSCLASQPRLVRAASRSNAFGPEPTTFEELLNRSALTPAQKQAWLRYGD
jgi:hypothetical protein